MGASGGPTPAVLQLHASRRCPLRCRHCYSSAGPEAGPGVELPVIERLLEDAADLGYESVALSGGEPLAHPDLASVVRTARACGLRVTAVTSGVTVTRAVADLVAEHLELVAVSVDGPPETHTALRGTPWAFTRMRAGLAALRASGAPFGVLQCVTAETWRHMAWVASFAADEGARLVQFHPLEEHGRATAGPLGGPPSSMHLACAWLVAIALRGDARLRVHLDACLRTSFLADPACFHAAGVAPATLPEATGVLVLEPDGVLVPTTFGIARHLAIADLRRERLRDAAPRWLADGYPAFAALARHVYEEVAADPGVVVFDWYARLLGASRVAAEPAALHRSASGIRASDFDVAQPPGTSSASTLAAQRFTSTP